MSDIPPVEGFLYRAVPKTAAEATSQLAINKVLTISKSAMQWYIKSYLDGRNKDLLNIAAPYTIDWTTESLDKNSREKQIQLRRLWQGMQGSIPQILIADTGGKNVSTEWLGSQDIGFKMPDGRVGSSIDFAMQVNLEIRISALDEQMFDELYTVLNLIFGCLIGVNKSYTITPAYIHTSDANAGQELGSWEVRIPLNFDIISKSSRARTDDPKDRIYTGGISTTIDFEDHIFVAFDQKFRTELNPYYDNNWEKQWQHCMKDRPATKIPDTVRLRIITPVRLPIPSDAIVYSDDPNVAIIQTSGPGQELRIHPKKVGKFNFVIAKKGAPRIPKDPGSNIVFSKEVRIVL